jgi:hypothetical protein
LCLKKIWQESFIECQKKHYQEGRDLKKFITLNPNDNGEDNIKVTFHFPQIYAKYRRRKMQNLLEKQEKGKKST